MEMLKKKTLNKTIITICIIVLFLAIFFNPFALTLEYFMFMSLNMKVCEFIYNDTPDKVGGIKISEFESKNVEDVYRKYNVALTKYDTDGNIVGLFCDVSWVFFMANNNGDMQNMIYAKVKDNVICNVQLFTYYTGVGGNDYLEELTGEQYEIALYFKDNYANGSKWDKYRW